MKEKPWRSNALKNPDLIEKQKEEKDNIKIAKGKDGASGAFIKSNETIQHAGQHTFDTHNQPTEEIFEDDEDQQRINAANSKNEFTTPDMVVDDKTLNTEDDILNKIDTDRSEEKDVRKNPLFLKELNIRVKRALDSLQRYGEGEISKETEKKVILAEAKSLEKQFEQDKLKNLKQKKEKEKYFGTTETTDAEDKYLDKNKAA